MTPNIGKGGNWLVANLGGLRLLNTICALVIVTAFMLLQTAYPPVLDALRRDLPGLQAGEWWRIITPLLVQSDGWPQFAANVAGLAIAGAAVETCCGKLRWAALVIIGGVAGEIAGYAWAPTGAGTSLAVCGLIGGFIASAWRNAPGRGWALQFSLYWLTALTGLALFGIVGTIVLCVVLGAVIGSARAIAGFERNFATIAVLAMLAEAAILSGLADNHGPAVLAGALTGFVLRPKGLPSKA